MIDQINMPQNLAKIPTFKDAKDKNEIEKVARDFSSVFFSEYLSIMLEQTKEDDEDFEYDIYRGLNAKVIGEKLVDSDAGHKISEMLMAEINRMKERMQDA